LARMVVLSSVWLSGVAFQQIIDFILEPVLF